MDQGYTDELYTMLDDMNSQIEDMVNNFDNAGKAELVLTVLAQKTKEFVDSFQVELEKIEMMETELT